MWFTRKARRRNPKISKLMITWKSLVVILAVLNILQFKLGLDAELAKKPAIQRFGILVFADGIKYRVNKYWGIPL